MTECGSHDEVILEAPVAALSWSDLRVPGAIAQLVHELTRRHQCSVGAAEANNSAFVVLLDLEQRLIALTTVNGDSFFVTARRALRAAIRHDATSIVVGIPRLGRSPAPTNNDFAVSKALMDGTRAIGLTLRDIVIATESEYYSFRECGMLRETSGG